MGCFSMQFIRVKLLFLFTIIILITLLSSCIGAGKGKSIVPPPREISGDDGCAVCGMPLADNPKWQSQIIMGDGRVAFFDSYREMFGYLLTMEKHGYARSLGTGTGPVAVWVKDHVAGNWTDAHGAWFVVGSRVMGAMGMEAIPFVGQKEAEQFIAENGGDINRYKDIDREKLKGLAGGR